MHPDIELTDEALNCLRYWQGHEMYGGSLSDVVVKMMEEWLLRDRTMANEHELAGMLECIKRGEF